MKLGVIVFAYRRYHYLNDAIASISKQTRTPNEILIFTDNRSAVKQVLEKYSLSADIIEEELTIPGVLGRVGEISSSDYVFPLDDDDAFKENKLEIIEKYLYKDSYVLLKHAMEFIDINSKTTTWIMQPEKAIVITTKNAWIEFRKFPYHMWTSSFAIRTKLISKYSAELKKMLRLIDFAVFILALQEGPILYVPLKLGYYRIGSGHSQLTSCDKLPEIICNWNAYAYDADFLMKLVNNNDLRKVIYYLYFSHLLKIYLLNTSQSRCNFTYNVSYFTLLKKSLFLVTRKIYPLRKALLLSWLSPLIGHKRAKNIYQKRLCSNIPFERY